MKSDSANKKMSYSMIKRKLFNEISKAQFDKIFKNQTYIGSGMQGEVYKANYGNELIAIKYFRKQFIGIEYISYIQSEIETLSEIKNQNIVSFIDSYQVVLGSLASQKKYCIVTEYCQQSLSSYHVISQLSDLKKLQMCLQIVSAVKAAHQKGIIHRDIKPQNILIKDLQTLTIKLADFGCCRIGDDNDLSMTRNVGTPLYADPNIQSGKYSKKCDVYSLGLVIVYIFCGRQYFSDCDTRDKLIKAKKRFCQDTQKQARRFFRKYDLEEEIEQFLINISFYTLSENEEKRLSSDVLFEFIKKEISNYEMQLENNELNSSQISSYSLNTQKSIQTADRLTQELKSSQQSSSESNNNLSAQYERQSFNSSQNEDFNRSTEDLPSQDMPKLEEKINQSQFIKKSHLYDQIESNINSQSKPKNQRVTSRVSTQRHNSTILSNKKSSVQKSSKLDERKHKIQIQSKVLSENQQLCAEIIKYSSQCSAINDECEAMSFLLNKLQSIKFSFQQIKKIQEVLSYSLTFQQKQTIALLFHFLYASQLKDFMNFLYGGTSKLFARFGKINEQNKQFIQSIIIKETQRIYPNLKRYAFDLNRKAGLIKPKLSSMIINLIGEVVMCGSSLDLLRINFQQGLVVNETNNFIGQKLKEIKNNDDKIIIEGLRFTSIQIVG